MVSKVSLASSNIKLSATVISARIALQQKIIHVREWWPTPAEIESLAGNDL
jgi:hypothetical protein